MPDLVNPLTRSQVVGSGGGANLSGLFGYDPEQYGKYFQNYSDFSGEKLAQIANRYQQDYSNIAGQGQKSFADMVSGARSNMGQSGFAGAGVFQKALSSGRQAIDKAQREALGEARFSRNADISGVEDSFYDKAMRTALSLMEGGADSNWTGSWTKSQPKKGIEVGEYKWMDAGDGTTYLVMWDGNSWVRVKEPPVEPKIQP